jgi:ABC-type branched-subunit amino acid transport system substrate-binding protein
MKKMLFRLMIPLYLVLITGCDDNDTTNYSVKIGGIFPFSGSLSEKGKPRHHAALLAIKHLQKTGYSVGWLVADSESQPIPGVEVARRLVEKGKVTALVGAVSSGATIAIAEQISIPYQLPQISYSSTSPQITKLPADEGQDFLFRTASSDALQGVILAQFAYDAGYRHLATLYVDNPYGRGLSEVFSQQFQALGGMVVATVPHPEFIDSEFETERSYLAELQLASTGDAEALVAISYPDHAKFYIKQAIKDNFFNQFLFVDGTHSERLVETVGAEQLEGMCGTGPGVDEQSESLKIFTAHYQTEYGEKPTVNYQPNSYDAVIITGLAAYAVQSRGQPVTALNIREQLRYVANPPGEPVLAGPDELRRAFALLEAGQDINYEGASGNVDFDENGDVVTPIEIWCYENGKPTTQRLEQPY